jgi:hypothetical protein
MASIPGKLRLNREFLSITSKYNTEKAYIKVLRLSKL